MGRTNKARLAVCSKAIVKQECLVFVFFSRLDDYNQTLLQRESNSDCMLFTVCLSVLVTSRPLSAIASYSNIIFSTTGRERFHVASRPPYWCIFNNRIQTTFFCLVHQHGRSVLCLLCLLGLSDNAV